MTHGVLKMYHSQRFERPSGFLKWINRYHWASELAQSLVQTPPRSLHVQTIDLSTARDVGNPLIIEVPGRGFVFYGYTGSSSTRAVNADTFVHVRINRDMITNFFPAKHQRGYRGDFSRLFLSWPAQSGISVDLVIFEFDARPWQGGQEAT